MNSLLRIIASCLVIDTMFFTSFVLFSAIAELITETGVEPACAAYETAELPHTLLRDNNKTHGNAYTLQT